MNLGTFRSRFLSSAVIMFGFLAHAANGQGMPGPFDSWDVSYHGVSVATDSLDGAHHVLYDPQDTARPWKMWWHSAMPAGQWNPMLSGADVIYFASSTNGVQWTAPSVALLPRAGAAGTERADDILVGSPTVLKINGQYLMFYEAYGKWMTTVARFFSVDRGDTWVTAGSATSLNHNWHESYALEVNGVLGFTPAFGTPGTHPIYSGQVVYAVNGKINRFLSCSPINDPGDGNTWTPLNFNQPVFMAYSNPGPGRIPLYACFDATFSNSFVSKDAACEPVAGFTRVRDTTWCPNGIIGYVAATTTSADMRHSNQNAVCLAVSNDGINWQRVQGAAGNGAMIRSQEPFTTLWPHNAWGSIPADNNYLLNLYETIRYDVYAAYGSGFPTVLIRDDHVELLFTDDTPFHSASLFPPLPRAWRIRIPVADILNPQAYVNAERQPVYYRNSTIFHGIPLDLRWSPMYKRYFWTDRSSTTPTTVRLMYSPFDPDPQLANGWLRGGHYDLPIVDQQNQGWVVSSAILANSLGHTVDFPTSPQGPYTTFGLYYQRCPYDPSDSFFAIFDTDIHYMLAFAYPDDRDGDGIPDWNDGCPDDPFKDDPGECGCGVPDEDLNGNGIADCNEEPCLPDLNQDGVLDFFDIALYLAWYAEGNPNADFVANGVLDFFDIQAFLNAFAAGCP